MTISTMVHGIGEVNSIGEAIARVAEGGFFGYGLDHTTNTCGSFPARREFPVNAFSWLIWMK
jgi:hypothetical protein